MQMHHIQDDKESDRLVDWSMSEREHNWRVAIPSSPSPAREFLSRTSPQRTFASPARSQIPVRYHAIRRSIHQN